MERKESTGLSAQVKMTLMQAWRERWSDVHWGVQLKCLLAKHPGDSCDLSEILLQQALIGSSPNTLVMSYLKHVVLSQVIPCSAVFKHISSFEDFSRPYCVLALVDLAETFCKNMSFTCSPDGSLALSKSLLLLVHWLLLCVLKCLQRAQETKLVCSEQVGIMEAASRATQAVLERPTIRALLQIARADVVDIYREFEQTELNVRGTLSQLLPNAIQDSTREKILAALAACSQLQESHVNTEPLLSGEEDLPMCPTINTLVALEAVLNPTNDTQPFVDQLIVIARLLKISWPRVYLEMLRACYMGIIDSTDRPAELLWAAFTFLKMPHILQKIQLQMTPADQGKDLEMALALLLEARSLLDIADTKQRFDCLSQFLHELARFRLITETQKISLLQKRSDQGFSKPDAQNVNAGKASLITRAELTVTSILKVETLDADYQKNQESLVGMLRHMLSRRSFEIILAAATPMGELGNFAVKLIKINEFARQPSGEGSKAAQTRGLLFDITFLMLCHVSQLYGSEVVGSSREASESFMMQWIQRWMPENGKYRNVDSNGPSDPSKVDVLLNQFSTGAEIRTNQTRWHEVCTNTPFALQEVLFAYEHGCITFDNVKTFLDNVKNRMSCLPVVACVWLCSYINMLPSAARAKPLQLLEYLTQPPADQTNQNESKTHLMTMVMEKVMTSVLPPGHPQKVAEQDPLPAGTLPVDVLRDTLDHVFSKGWVSLTSLHHLEQLLDLGGPDWFADKVTLTLLESNKKSRLNKALRLVVSIFHLDLEQLTHSLLASTIPRLLHSPDLRYMLAYPRGYTLAKLAVMCITAAQAARIDHREPFVRRGIKRLRAEIDEESDDVEVKPSKMRRLTEPQLTLQSDEFNFDDLAVKEDGETSPTFDSKEPINKALGNLFHLMNAIVHEGTLTSRIDFIIAFIEATTKCGAHYSRYILQFMPSNMLQQMMKMKLRMFTNSQILQICDLTTANGRKMASKAICHNCWAETDQLGSTSAVTIHRSISMASLS